MDVVCQEIEFEDFEVRAEFWAKVPSLPGIAPLMEEWRKANDRGRTNEFLDLIE